MFARAGISQLGAGQMPDGLGEALKNRSTTAARFALTSLTAAVLTALAGQAMALGLGRLNVLSALGEPLRADIEVTSLTQEEAGRIIGGGRRAFQKYERGTMQPSEAAVGLIEILDRHPNEVATLRNIRR